MTAGSLETDLVGVDSKSVHGDVFMLQWFSKYRSYKCADFI